MSYSFDLAAAIDAIAALEDAIATPTPGITNAYGHGENPVAFIDPSALPAIVHLPRGPHTTDGLTRDTWTIMYDVESYLLVIEAVPDQYPADDEVANLFWKPIVEAFLTDATRTSLVQSSGAHNYWPVFLPNSYAVRSWPPVPGSTNLYWSLMYTHRFLIYGG